MARFVHCTVATCMLLAFCLTTIIVAQDNVIPQDLQPAFEVDGNLVTPCDTSLRQVFKLLSVSSENVLIGSTECLYVFKADMTLKASQKIELDELSTDYMACSFAAGADVLFKCKNYISYGYEVNATTYAVCGTYSSASPRCYTCTYNDSNLTCDEGSATSDMPRNPTQNFTVVVASDYYFTGGLDSHTRDDHIFAKVPVDGTGQAISTAAGEDQLMNTPVDFVGDPIEYGPHIYFFFREKALEYENIGQIIYSRVARVCKNDAGGSSSPLTNEFTTYVKTRLTCSVGASYPFYYNEIQDTVRYPDDGEFVYGLFTTPNAGRSHSAVCRYDLGEIAELFNADDRRGQETPTKMWQRITMHADDVAETRTCERAYDLTVDDVYIYLKAYPLMNTNAPNCGLGSTCGDYSRASDDALAVFNGIRGQQLAIESVTVTSDEVTLYIGTNNAAIIKYTITSTGATREEKLMVKGNTSMTEDELRDKWPYGISYMTVLDGTLYGTLDNGAFRYNNATETTPSPAIKLRSEKRTYSHPVKITDAATNVDKIFEAPKGSEIVALFSGGLEGHECTQKRIVSDANCNEFLHVHVTFRGDSAVENGLITVESQSGMVASISETIVIDIDNSEISVCVPLDVRTYDLKMAKYRYQFQEWLRDGVTCDPGIKDTCPSPTQCPGNC